MLFRVYLYFFDGYSKTYGSLGAVIVLLLWLYIFRIGDSAGRLDQFRNRKCRRSTRTS
jgi:hypothetical protein